MEVWAPSLGVFSRSTAGRYSKQYSRGCLLPTWRPSSVRITPGWRENDDTPLPGGGGHREQSVLEILSICQTWLGAIVVPKTPICQKKKNWSLVNVLDQRFGNCVLWPIREAAVKYWGWDTRFAYALKILKTCFWCHLAGNIVCSPLSYFIISLPIPKKHCPIWKTTTGMPMLQQCPSEDTSRPTSSRNCSTSLIPRYISRTFLILLILLG